MESFKKRQKEARRLEKQRDKTARRFERKHRGPETAVEGPEDGSQAPPADDPGAPQPADNG